MTPTADPFDTAGLRAAVFDAWRSSPTRYREDANVEEDYALGAYRDRLIVELAQNAADAARAAGVPGRVRIALGEDGMGVTNNGAPLDLAGVHSLAAMRASAKGADAVGRFGVGFAAVLSVTDAPAIVSRAGGVRFSRTDTADLMLPDATLARLVKTRRPPTLRVPFAYRDDAPEGYDTLVILPWLDVAARERGNAAVAAIDDALFIGLPDLVELIVQRIPGDIEQVWTVQRHGDTLTVDVNGQARRWLLKRATGSWPQGARAAAPTEAGQRPDWQLTWALPVTADGAVQPWPPEDAPGAPRRVVHAPTPTDEPLELPALLVADLPVDATRRRLAGGPMADVVLDAAAEAYCELVQQFAATRGADAAALVPEPHLAGPIDDRLRTSIRERLARAPWLPGAKGGSATPSALVAVEPADPRLVELVVPHVADLLDPSWYPHLPLLRGLGLEVRPLADLWDALASAPITPAGWREVYDAASALDANALEGIPVPLVDGRVLRGARGAVVPEGLPDGFADGSADTLALLGADVVHEAAAHPLLLRLGARPFELASVLGEGFADRVADAVVHDPSEARAMVEAAVQLLASAGVEPGALPWLGAVPVPVADGWRPASSVVLPGSRLDASANADAPRLASGVAADPAGWRALGVLADLVPVRLPEQPLDPDVWESQLSGGGSWCLAVADLVGAEDPGELLVLEATAVRGVELVAPSADALDLLAAPEVRVAITGGALVLTGDGRRVPVPSPSAWVLGEAPVLRGRCPVEVRLPGDDRLAPFFPEVSASAGGDRELLAALGVHTTLEAWLASPGGADELLDALADDSVDVDPALLVQLGAALADLDALPDAPPQVRAVTGGTTAVVDAADAVVAAAPHHALVLHAPHVPGPVRLADVLDVELSDDERCGASDLAGTGVLRPVPALSVLPAGGPWPVEYREHDELVVAGVEVEWWVTDDGEVHAATLDGLARGLAWAGSCWGRRFELAALLERPVDERSDRVERYFD